MIVNESTKLFIIFMSVFCNLENSSEIVIFLTNSINPLLNAFSITNCLLKFNSYGSESSILEILYISALTKLVENLINIPTSAKK